MALGANSYGDTGEIASLCPMHTSGGLFTTGTRPTLAQVESFTDQTSAIANTVLAEFGFTVPVTQADVRLALDMFVNAEVAAIVEGVNGSGRFGPTQKNPGSRRYILITEDVRGFIEGQALGFERLGAARSYSLTAGLGYRDADNAGDETFPLFQRDSFPHEFVDADPV